jgi:hypothetical protein
VLSVPLLKWYFYDYVWNKVKKNDIHFTPTTVMEICNKKYVFVIYNTIIKKGKVIFKISTKDINYGKLNKLSKINKGQFKNVRFDIDGKTWGVPSCTQYYSVSSCNTDQCDDWNDAVTNSGDSDNCPNDDGTYTNFEDTCGECCFDQSPENSGCIDEGYGN